MSDCYENTIHESYAHKLSLILLQPPALWFAILLPYYKGSSCVVGITSSDLSYIMTLSDLKRSFIAIFINYIISIFRYLVIKL